MKCHPFACRGRTSTSRNLPGAAGRIPAARTRCPLAFWPEWQLFWPGLHFPQTLRLEAASAENRASRPVPTATLQLPGVRPLKAWRLPPADPLRLPAARVGPRGSVWRREAVDEHEPSLRAERNPEACCPLPACISRRTRRRTRHSSGFRPLCGMARPLASPS